MVVALWALGALVLLGVAVVVAVLWSESLHKKEKAVAVAAVEALAKVVAETALMLDETSPAPEGEHGWMVRLHLAQTDFADGLHHLPALVRHDLEVTRWVWVESDLITARSWQLVELARGGRPGDTQTVEVSKDMLVELLLGYAEVTNNLRRLRSEELGVADAQNLRSHADEQLLLLYERNGWPLPFPTRTGGIRWPADSLSLLTAD